MYEILITKVKETLLSVENVKDVFSGPKTKLTKFPSVFFSPSGFTNTFETQRENFAVYRFLALVLVGTNASLTVSQAFEQVLPHTVDAIINKFNAEWNLGTIDGHRCWVKIDSIDAWRVSEEEDGLIAYAPLNIEIKLLTEN